MNASGFMRENLTRVAKASALAFVFFSLFGGKTFAATDWTAIQTAMGTSGTAMPGNVLRFELARTDLSLTIDGQPEALTGWGALQNGFVAFKPDFHGDFFVDGALPAQETELAALETALRTNKDIAITGISNRLVLESPAMIWVYFEGIGNGGNLATSIASALTTIHNPQHGFEVIPGTDNVIDPASILPPNFLKLFDEGFVEQLAFNFAFYLPRPDENRISLADVPAEPGLGVGQSFYIQADFSGGTNVTLDIDFALTAEETQPVEDVLRAGGFTITSESSHLMVDFPQMYFVHARASGDGFSLGNALYSAVQLIGAHPKHF